MKYFCIEFEECGFYEKTYDLEIHKSLVCPWCYSLLLMYEDDYQPSFLDQVRGLDTPDEDEDAR